MITSQVEGHFSSGTSSMPVATNHNPVSDSEDEDYVPPVHEQESDSDKSVHEPEEAPPKLVEADPEEKKRKRDELWAEFQASVSTAKPPETQHISARMIKIEKKYRFAGNEVVEVVEVPEDSPEAKKWCLWKDSNPDLNPSENVPTSEPRDSVEVQREASADEAKPSDNSTTQLQNQSDSITVIPKTGLGKRPGPRKSKTTLAPIPTSKPKKITTLNKSAMDWRAHIQTEEETGSSLRDELEVHRKAGGYLEKVEFLKRVEGRKEENLDVMKSSKRRKL